MKIKKPDTATQEIRTGSDKDSGHEADKTINHDKSPEYIQPEPSSATPSIPQEIPPRDYTL